MRLLRSMGRAVQSLACYDARMDSALAIEGLVLSRRNCPVSNQRAEGLFNCPRCQNLLSYGIQLGVLRAADTSLNCLGQWPETQRQLLEDDLHPALRPPLCDVATQEVALIFVSE